MDWGSRVVLLMFISAALSDDKDSTDIGDDVTARIEPSGANDVTERDRLSAAVNELGFKLMLEEMKLNNNSNVILSPTGIAGLLAMTLLGTAGAAYSELASTLGFCQGKAKRIVICGNHLTCQIRKYREVTDVVVQITEWKCLKADILKNRAHHEEFGELLHSLNNNASSKTSYSDAIFVEPSARVRPVYRDYLRRVYRGDAFTAPFGDPPRARDTINEWVRNSTNGRIEEFLKEPLPAETRVALLTALYFSGQWDKPFTPKHTVKMAFKSPGGDVMADLMLTFGEYKYIHSQQDGLHMVALPYNDSTTTMYALMPNRRSQATLPELMAGLNYSRIDQLISRMTPERSVIRFPKMEIKSSTHLEDSLKALGLNAIFSAADANFALMIDANKETNATEDELLTRITLEDREQEIKDAVRALPNPGVHVDTVLHDVKISINEYGTEAVAATGGFLTRTAEQFYANSPFYMFIRNDKTGLVTFSAAIFDPTV